MKIALKYIKRYEDSITPHYNEDGELRGIAIKKVTPDNYGGSITIGPIQPNFCSPNFSLNKNEVICSAVSP